MANNTSKIRVNDTSSSWDSFKMPAGGTAVEMRKNVEALRITITKEKIAFSGLILPQSSVKPK